MDRQQTNNVAFRALFTLPPIAESASTALAVPEMPKQATVTGDREIDAVLWLQSLVQTGHQEFIDKALEAVKRIRTPMKTLEKRYAEHLRNSGAHVFQVLFGTMDFGELESRSTAVITKARNKHEALARFGDVDSLFADTPAEKACLKALRGLKTGVVGMADDEAAYARFSRRTELSPSTIADSLHGRAYWSDLYRLRAAVGGYGDSLTQGFAHECYCRFMLGQIKPRDAEEAMATFDHLYDSESEDSKEAPAILRNLVSSGWESHNRSVSHQQGVSQ